MCIVQTCKLHFQISFNDDKLDNAQTDTNLVSIVRVSEIKKMAMQLSTLYA